MKFPSIRGLIQHWQYKHGKVIPWEEIGSIKLEGIDAKDAEVIRNLQKNQGGLVDVEGKTVTVTLPPQAKK